MKEIKAGDDTSLSPLLSEAKLAGEVSDASEPVLTPEQLHEKQMEEKLDLEKQMKMVRLYFPGLRLSDKEARNLVLQSMDVYSGDEAELAQRGTMKMAHTLVRNANGGEGEDHEIAEKGLKGMGLERVGQDKHYSLQGAANKLGMDRSQSWRDAMQSTQEQGDYYDPFLKDRKKD